MNTYFTKAKWFVAFVCAAMVATSTFTGCANNDSGTNPTVTAPQMYNPMSANMRVDLTRTIDIQNRHTDELMAIDGVIGTGAGLNEGGAPAVYVFTKRAGVTGIPSSVEGTPTFVVNTGEIEARAFTGQYRNPMYSGVSVGNDKECAAGTISCVVTKNNKKYLLSNNHVFARVNAANIGERIDQQGRYDAIPQCGPSGQVASLSQFVPINFRRRTTNTVDCAISEVAAGINWTSQTPPETAPALQYTPSSTTIAPSVGLNVMKTGRTTGFTTGSIAAVNVTVQVSYGNNQNATFVGQVYINSATFSAAGDSGSLIVEAGTSGSPSPVALLFAGSATSTIANPINGVLAALGVTIIPF
jgi:hypothetical protein